jgi:hypothetical protein
MKGFLGYLLLTAGLICIIFLVERDLSFWFAILAFGLFGAGLDLVIDDKIESYFKDKQKNDFPDLPYKI